MDSFKVVRPQFNVVLFQRTVQLTINKKMTHDLISFIRASNQFLLDYGDMVDDMVNVLNGNTEISGSPEGDYQINRYKDVITITMECECASVMADFILQDATHCCKVESNLSISSFVALGRKLKDAGEGNYTNLTNPNRGPIREIIIRREIMH